MLNSQPVAIRTFPTMTFLAFTAVEIGPLEQLGRWLEALLLPIMARFVAEGSHFAPGLAALLIFIALGFAVGLLVVRIVPAWASLHIRHRRVSGAMRGAETYYDRRAQFAAQYVDIIDPAMDRGFQDPLSRSVRGLLRVLGRERELSLAWSEFKETFVDEDAEQEKKNSARPHGYLMRAIVSPAKWNGLAGLFVSLGLLATFVGIIAVLMKAGCDLQPDTYSVCDRYLGEVEAVELSLGTAQAAEGDAPSAANDEADTESVVIGIVGGAASKFYASIGGLAASILLKVLISLYTAWMRHSVEALSDQIESGLAFIPEQGLAIEQLRALREQSDQLKKFNTDMAIAMNEAIAPVQRQLDSLESAVKEQGDRTVAAMSGGASEAISAAAGGEIRELGRTLQGLTDELSQLSGKLNDGGQAAANQMHEAADAIKSMFENLRAEQEGMARTLTEGASSANQEMSAAAGQVVEALKESLQQMDTASQANAELLEKMGQQLDGTVEQLSTETVKRLQDALEKAGAETRQIAEDAGHQMGEALKNGVGAWFAPLKDVQSKLDELSEAISKNAAAAQSHATAIGSASKSTQDASAAIKDTAQSLQSVASPLTQSIREMGEAAAAVKAATVTHSERTQELTGLMKTAAEQMAETAASAQSAWESYRDRFDTVDEDLEAALQQITKSLEQNVERIKGYVTDIDSELADAVSQFAGAVEPLTNLADDIEEVVAKMNRETGKRD